MKSRGLTNAMKSRPPPPPRSVYFATFPFLRVSSDVPLRTWPLQRQILKEGPPQQYFFLVKVFKRFPIMHLPGALVVVVVVVASVVVGALVVVASVVVGAFVVVGSRVVVSWNESVVLS